MKVALVHDYLLRLGGAERVLLGISKIFPEAPIYTLYYDQKHLGPYFSDKIVRTSFLQRTPILKHNHRWALPLMPAVVESIDLRDYDLVISSCSAYVKGLVLRPKVKHICYCHSPTRFLWDWTHQYDSPLPSLRKLIFHYQRMWDRSAANRVDYFIANSHTTAQRIKKYYGRDSQIIYPPVNLQTWQPTNNISYNYYLIVSQLTPYKRIDIAIDAFNKLELNLIIIGEGKDRMRLEKMANKNIKFLGWQPDNVVREFYKHCTAFIFCGEEDFGITAVEAMSYGKPVLAYGKGGVTESVLEGVTGEFFEDPVSESLADGIRRLIMSGSKYDPQTIRKRAEKFSEERFIKEFKKYLSNILLTDKVVS